MAGLILLFGRLLFRGSVCFPFVVSLSNHNGNRSAALRAGREWPAAKDEKTTLR
jgi:hypothetical protein